MSDDARTNRRQFLQGRSAAQALTVVLDGGGEPGGPALAAAPAAEPYLVHVGRRAMACQFEVYLNAGQYAAGLPAAIAALDLVDELESQLTVYRESSEIMAINRQAAEQAVEVEPRLYDLLRQAQALNRETDGAFDITSGPLTKTWGFYRRQGAVPQPDDLVAALACVGGDKFVLDDGARTIRFTRPGVELNLGAIGKGYALDRCAEQLMAAGIHDFLLHGGSSSVLARGRQASSAEESGGWMVSILDPFRPGRELARLRLRDRAIGTSGNRQQFFRHQGKRYGHIIDPRTGQPADGVLSATVVAPTAAEADALSTACFILGPDQALAYCDRHPEIAAILLTPAETGDRVELHAVGFQPDELQWTAEKGSAAAQPESAKEFRTNRLDSPNSHS